jgi:hypothetical protein
VQRTIHRMVVCAIVMRVEAQWNTSLSGVDYIGTAI